MELETTIHSLEKSQIRRKLEPSISTTENTSQALDLDDNNLSNTKQIEPVPQNKEILRHACGSEKHEIKDCESKRNIYIRSKRNQIIGMAFLATEEQAKLAIKMLNKTNQFVANEYKHRNETNNLNKSTQEKDKRYKKPVEDKKTPGNKEL